ncbi:Iron-sulfur cluster insertion protein ErpA [uncultured archaeon]|nr:Iron-sulfur cluster insertion protein ErpA [uncultured archaeon]
MIEITEAAASMIERSLVEGKVIRMFLAAIDATGANYGLELGEEEKDDIVFESRGVKIYMSPKDAELLSETIIDYVDDDRGTGFIIRGPEDEVSGCSACANADTCDHDHDSCEHDHDDCGCGCS